MRQLVQTMGKNLPPLLTLKSIPLFLGLLLFLSTILLVAQTQVRQTTRQEAAAGQVDEACIKDKCKQHCNGFAGTTCSNGDIENAAVACQQAQKACYKGASSCTALCYPNDDPTSQSVTCMTTCRACEGDISTCVEKTCPDKYNSCDTAAYKSCRGANTAACTPKEGGDTPVSPAPNNPVTPKPKAACDTGESLGGIIKDKPAAETFKNELHVFVKGNDNAVYALHAKANGQEVAWSNWESLEGVLSSNVSTKKETNTLYIVATGDDNASYHRASTDGRNFEAWTKSTSTVGDSNVHNLHIVSFNGRTYTFTKGNNDNLCVSKSAYTAPATPVTPAVSAAPSTDSSTCTQGNFSCVRYACEACTTNTCRAQVQSKYSWATCESTTTTSTATDVCRDNPVVPPSGYNWKADCSKKCTTNSDCPTNPPLANTNWCYGFETGARCLQLQAGTTTSSSSTSCNTVNGNNSCPEGNYSCIRYACKTNDITCATCVAPWLTSGDSPW